MLCVSLHLFVCVSVCGSVCGEGVRVQPYWEPPFVSDASCMFMYHPCVPASLPLLTPVYATTHSAG